MRNKMQKRTPPNLFARVVCANAPYVIAAALCGAGLLSALVLSAFLPGLWSLAGFAAVLLIAGLPLLGKWSRREYLLESRLGVRAPAPAVQAAAPSVPKSLPARPGVVLGAIPDCG
jgi:hypothetical protein